MHVTSAEVLRDLVTIRTLMEKAKTYRHLPAAAPLAGAVLSAAAAYGTHVALAREGAPDLGLLGAMWGGVFLATLAVQLWFSRRWARREGALWFTPLAAEIVHALWPPLVVAGALSVVLARHNLLDLVPAVWMLCYGTAGFVCGAYARRAVRVLGLSFLAAGLACLFHPFPTAWALGATFGGFHAVYGLVLAARPPQG